MGKLVLKMLNWILNKFKSKEYRYDDNGDLVELNVEKNSPNKETEKLFQIIYVKDSDYYIVNYKKAKSNQFSYLDVSHNRIDLSLKKYSTKFKSRKSAIAAIERFKNENLGYNNIIEEY